MTEYRITTFEGAYRIEERAQLDNGQFGPWEKSYVAEPQSFEEAKRSLAFWRNEDRRLSATWTPVNEETGEPKMWDLS